MTDDSFADSIVMRKQIEDCCRVKSDLFKFLFVPMVDIIKEISRINPCKVYLKYHAIYCGQRRELPFRIEPKGFVNCSNANSVFY